MPQSFFSSSPDWPSFSPSSDPLEPARLEALAVSFSFAPVVIVPLKNGRLAIVTGYGSRTYRGSCAPSELGLIMAQGLPAGFDNASRLRNTIDNPAPMPYTTHTEDTLGITFDL